MSTFTNRILKNDATPPVLLKAFSLGAALAEKSENISVGHWDYFGVVLEISVDGGGVSVTTEVLISFDNGATFMACPDDANSETQATIGALTAVGGVVKYWPVPVVYSAPSALEPADSPAPLLRVDFTNGGAAAATITGRIIGRAYGRP